MSRDVRTALAVAVGARVPVLLWGGPGLGKSSAVREIASAAGLSCQTVIASIREPSDFAGLPIVSEDGTTVRFAPPIWAEQLAATGSGVLFLDEISTAPPAVQAALLRVVLERTVGDLALPEDVTVIAAANPPEQSADGWDISPPLANRFCHLDWDLNAREWADGILAGFDQPAVPALEPGRLGAELAAARASVGAFAVSRPHLLHAHPGNEAAGGRAWPSPRSWEMAARLIAATHVSGAGDQVGVLLVSGAVGVAAAAEFLAWREDIDLPDPEDALRDPASFKLPRRGDRAYAALASVTAAVLADNTAERWEAAWHAVAVAADGGHADIAVAAIRSLISHRPDGGVPPARALTRMAPVLRTAGLFERLTGGTG
ncbi:MAG TPA: AAA family ATPase [Streptosporangiaceae bacterium]|nr:AAA family ATPase [Streptosporangiaceae bacterium]